MQSLSQPLEECFRVDLDESFVYVNRESTQTFFDFKHAGWVGFSLDADTPPPPAGNLEMKHEIMCRFLRHSSSLVELTLILRHSSSLVESTLISGTQFVSVPSRMIMLPTRYYSAVSSNPHIKELVLHIKPTAEDLCVIVQMKSNIKLYLEHLDPQGLDLDSGSGALLRDAFASNTSLESLTLAECVGPHAAELLLSAASNSKISELIFVNGMFQGVQHPTWHRLFVYCGHVAIPQIGPFCATFISWAILFFSFRDGDASNVRARECVDCRSYDSQVKGLFLAKQWSTRFGNT